MEGGDIKFVSEEVSGSLSNGQVLIKVAYTPVTQFDRACLKVKQSFEKPEDKLCGSEGSGTIEAVASDLDQGFKGKKVAFCHGAWSQYVI